MTKAKEINDLAEALVSYLNEEKRDYVIFFPLDEGNHFIATNADVASVLGLIYTLVKSYDIPIEKVSALLTLLKEKDYIDTSKLKIDE